MCVHIPLVLCVSRPVPGGEGCQARSASDGQALDQVDSLAARGVFRNPWDASPELQDGTRGKNHDEHNDCEDSCEDSWVWFVTVVTVACEVGSLSCEVEPNKIAGNLTGYGCPYVFFAYG